MANNYDGHRPSNRTVSDQTSLHSDTLREGSQALAHWLSGITRLSPWLFTWK